MSVLEKKLFRIGTTLSVYPIFYVEAVDILEATRKAKAITDWYTNDKVVANVSAVDIPFLHLEQENEN